jgi:soluble lytic murein transglycosylase
MRTSIVAAFGAITLLAASCSGEGGTPRIGPPASEPTEGTPAVSPTSPASPPATPLPPTPTPVVNATLDEAQRLYRAGEAPAAAAVFAAVAASSKEPQEQALAYLRLGVALNEAGDRPGSIDALRKSIAAAPAGAKVRRQAVYLLGLRLNEAEAWDEAASVLAGELGAEGDSLRPYIRAEYAKAATRAGNVAAAEPVWNALVADPGTPASLQAMAAGERAAAARQLGDYGNQLNWLAQQAALTGSPDVRMQTALLAKELGNSAVFADQLRTIVARNPGNANSIRAIDELRRAGFALNLGEAGYAYYSQRRYAEARDILLAAIEEPVSPTALTYRNYYLAASYEGLGDYARAVAYYDRAATLETSSEYAHRAKWWAARLLEEMGEASNAATRYLALVREGPQGQFTSDAAFRTGFALLKAGRPDAAIEAWRAAGATSDPRLLYWRGRAYASIGDVETARLSYQAAYDADPLSFHGLEAGRLLNIRRIDRVDYVKLEPPPPSNWDALEAWLRGIIPGAPIKTADTAAAADFLAVGLRSRASGMLLQAAANASPWRLFQLTREAHDLGLPEVSARLAVRIRWATGLTDMQIPVEFLRLEYPVDYVTILDGEGRANNLDPLFIAAMIRQESFWDPSAGSHAGALGLTQVIKSTGEAIANALGLAEFQHTDLFRPALSLKFGAFYLGGRVKQFDNPYHALAAYNGGAGNAQRWANASLGGTPADFVEAIDFDETYHYVECVTEHYARYLRAYRGLGVE